MSTLDDSKTKTYWKKCSTCKKELAFKGPYYTCSVSTCQGKRTGLHFCSVPCWDAHLGFARHLDAGALDAIAPSREVYLASLDNESPAPATKKLIVRSTVAQASPSASPEVETLVVVSKVKNVIRQHSDMNTSQCAIDALTDKIVEECRKAIDNARTAGRKTVMGRDFKL